MLKKPRKLAGTLKRRGGKPAPSTVALEKAALFATRRLLARHMSVNSRLFERSVELWIYNSARIAALVKAIQLIKGTPRR